MPEVAVYLIGTWPDKSLGIWRTLGIEPSGFFWNADIVPIHEMASRSAAELCCRFSVYLNQRKTEPTHAQRAETLF